MPVIAGLVAPDPSSASVWAGVLIGRLTGDIASKMLVAISGEGAMTDKNKEPDELEQLLADALEPKGDLPTPPLDLEALGMQVRSKAPPRGRDNKGSGRRGG